MSDRRNQNQIRGREAGDAEKQAAASFGLWQKRARSERDWNIPALAKASGFSDTQVRLFDAEGKVGIDDIGRYRRPRYEYIEKIALVTGADLTSGLEAAGLLTYPPTDVPIVPKGFRLLSVAIAPESNQEPETVIQLIVRDDFPPEKIRALQLSVRVAYQAINAAWKDMPPKDAG